MDRACQRSVGFMVHLTNVYVNQDNSLQIKGALPILRIFDENCCNKDDLTVRSTSYPLGIAPTFNFDKKTRKEYGFEEIQALTKSFRTTISTQFQKPYSNGRTAFEDAISNRIWRLQENHFRLKMSKLETISQGCQTWPEAKRKLDFFKISPKLISESDDDFEPQKKKRRRILSSSDESDVFTNETNDSKVDDVKESIVFDYTAEQLDEMVNEIDIGIFKDFVMQEAEVADNAISDDSDNDGYQSVDDATQSDDDFIAKEDAHDGAPGIIKYTVRQQQEFEKNIVRIMNDEDCLFKWLTRADFLKIINQSEVVLPFLMRQIKQIIANKERAGPEEKALLKNLKPNFDF